MKGKVFRSVGLLTVVAGVILFGSSFSWAAQSELIPTDDSWVNENGTTNQAKNYGDEDEIKAASLTGQQAYNKNKRSFLKFDLSTIPDGCTIDGASLELYLIDFSGNSARTHDLAYVETDTWVETSINWTNQPNASTLLASASIGTNDGVTVTWSDTGLTSQLASEYANDNILSLRISDQNENATGNKEGIYASKENTTYPKPKLTVSYTCGGQEGCSHGFWKNHPIEWQTGYAPSDLLITYFSYIPVELQSDDLETALEYGGGKDFIGAARILLRNAVASLLNAADPDIYFPLTQQEVIAAVNDALKGQDRATALSLEEYLDGLNNLGSPVCSD